jgi:type I restriction enzyme, S subunit
MSSLVSPKGWNEFTIGEIVKIERTAVQPENIKTGTLYVGLEHITSEGQFIEVRPVENGELASSKFAFNSKHLLYGKLRPYLKKIARPNFSGVCSTDILPILPGSKIDINFLYYHLRQQNLIDLATARSTGVNLPRLSPKTLAEFPIFIPPLEEQRRIAAILDKADAIRRKRQEAIRLTEELLRSTFLEMFGDPVTNPKGWVSGTLSDVVSNIKNDVRCGPFGTQLKVEEIVSDGIPLLGIENVKGGRFKASTSKYITPSKAKELASFEVQAGDVLITRMGTIGHACVIPDNFEEARFSYHLFRIRPNQSKCLPGFLSATITWSGTFLTQLERLSHGAIMAGLKTADLKEVRFLIPPINLQKQYLRVVEHTEKLLENQKKRIKIEDNLFNSLLHYAFRGEL